MRHWARRFELINFKVIVRGKVAGWSPEQIGAQLFPLGSLEGLPVEALIHSEDVAEMLRRLEVGYYARMAHQARSAYEQGHSLFDVEAILDRAYLEDLMDHVAYQPRDERKALHRLLGPLLDQINLVWLLRYRFAYGLDPSHTYYLLGPGGEHIRHATLMDLARPEEMEAVLERLPPVVRDQIGEERDTGTIEATLSQRTEDIAWQALRFHPFRLVEAVAYLLLRERQLIRLQGIVKGMRLGLPPETIREALLQEEGGGKGE